MLPIAALLRACIAWRDRGKRNLVVHAARERLNMGLCPASPAIP